MRSRNLAPWRIQETPRLLWSPQQRLDSLSGPPVEVTKFDTLENAEEFPSSMKVDDVANDSPKTDVWPNGLVDHVFENMVELAWSHPKYKGRSSKQHDTASLSDDSPVCLSLLYSRYIELTVDSPIGPSLWVDQVCDHNQGVKT